MNLFHLKIPAGYKNTIQYRQTMASKNLDGFVTSISIKNFNFDEFIYFKIPAGYKKHDR